MRSKYIATIILRHYCNSFVLLSGIASSFEHPVHRSLREEGRLGRFNVRFSEDGDISIAHASRGDLSSFPRKAVRMEATINPEMAWGWLLVTNLHATLGRLILRGFGTPVILPPVPVSILRLFDVTAVWAGLRSRHGTDLGFMMEQDGNPVLSVAKFDLEICKFLFRNRCLHSVFNIKSKWFFSFFHSPVKGFHLFLRGGGGDLTKLISKR